MSTLVAEAESTKAFGGVYYGLSLYETPEGRFQAVLHTRTYDGVRVASKWDSDRIDLAALGKEVAWDEGVRQLNALRRSANGATLPGDKEEA